VGKLPQTATSGLRGEIDNVPFAVLYACLHILGKQHASETFDAFRQMKSLRPAFVARGWPFSPRPVAPNKAAERAWNFMLKLG
jgi:hypothetical protein